MVQKLSFTANSITLGTGNSRVILGADSGNLTVKDKDANTSIVTPGTGIAGFSGVTTYANSSVFPFSPISSAGSLAYATATSTLYLSNGSGWYKISTINTSPSISLSSTTAQPSIGALTLDFTYTVTEPEGTPTSVSIANSGIATTGNVAITHTTSNNHVRLVFDGTTAYSSDATVTLTVTDGVNTGTGTITIITNYISLVDNSESTAILMRGVGDSTTNNANFDDVSDTNNTITTSGTPYMGTFSPYNSAGYSTYFADGGDDYLKSDVTSTLNLANNTNWTLEGWYYFTDAPGTNGRYLFSNDNGTFSWSNINYMCYFNTSSTLKLEWGGGQNVTMSFTPELNKWYHIAYSCDGTTIRAFVDGHVRATSTGSSQFYTYSNAFIQIGRPPAGYGSSKEMKGYVSDFRIVVGTCVYNADFTVPNERLTAVTNTKLLTCNDPYIYGKDTSGALTLTPYGNIESRPISPYRHKTYVASDFGGSVYMDGNGDKLTSTGSELLSIGSTSAAFTIEAWIYISTHVSGTAAIFSRASGNTSNVFALDFDSSGNIKLMLGGGYTGSDVKAQYNSVLKLKTWHHVALVRASATDTKLYVDGIVATDTGGDTVYSTNWTVAAGTTAYIGTAHYDGGGASTRTLDGFISDLRIVKGAAVYTGAFTPPSGPLTKTGGTYPSSTNVSNPTASQTKLLMNFTNGDIIDHSGTSNIKPNGNAQSDTGVQKYGVPSVLFDGTGDFLSIPYSDLYAPGSGNYTAECWIYTATDNQTQPLLMGMWNGNSAYSWALQLGAGTSMYPRFLFWDGSSYNDNPATTKITISAWNHIAVVRNHNIFTLFLNGVSVKTATITGTAATVDTPLTIGATSSGGQPFTGNISDARFTKSSRYPFIPLKQTVTTTTSFQDGITCTASNVKLLALTTSTITADASAENHTITNVNSTAASTFGPTGGMKSALFDESSDNKLTIPDGAWKTHGATFTFDMWIYANTFPHATYNYIFGDFNSAGANNSNALSLYSNNSGTLGIIGQSGGSDFNLTATQNISASRWYHVAVVRNSGNFYIFLDGTMVLENTGNTGTLNDSTQVFAIGGIGAYTSLQWDGYISNFRYNNAQALYTKNFTVPSAALTG